MRARASLVGPGHHAESVFFFFSRLESILVWKTVETANEYTEVRGLVVAILHVL